MGRFIADPNVLVLEGTKINGYAGEFLKTVNGVSYSFTNNNQFLRPTHANYFEYVVGLKTGTTNPAGNCIVTAAEINRRFVIISTFYNGTSAGRYTNSKYLYDLVFKQK